MSDPANFSPIPIVRVGGFLLVSIQVDLDDRAALQLQEELAERISSNRAQGVLIDVSSVQMIDSFIGRTLSNTALISRLLGAETVVVGIQPAVAITLVELGLSLEGVRTAMDMDSAMELLQKMAGTTSEAADGDSF